MTPNEFRLLLTVARILRARVREDQHDPSGHNAYDYRDLTEALAPFDPAPGAPVNEADRGRSHV